MINFVKVESYQMFYNVDYWDVTCYLFINNVPYTYFTSGQGFFSEYRHEIHELRKGHFYMNQRVCSRMLMDSCIQFDSLFKLLLSDVEYLYNIIIQDDVYFATCSNMKFREPAKVKRIYSLELKNN